MIPNLTSYVASQAFLSMGAKERQYYCSLVRGVHGFSTFTKYPCSEFETILNLNSAHVCLIIPLHLLQMVTFRQSHKPI